MQLPSPGDWFQRRYELGELLGKGGFAAVYRAIDHDVGREVAIKILMPDHNGYEPGLVQRFLREGRIVAGLQDPHTITMFDFGRTETDLLFMVFEYVPGSDLSKLLIRTGPMPEREVTHILQQLLSALREAHNAGILHRDIKPANVLVHSYMEDNRRVKLLDFGIAKPTMQEGEVDELEESTKSGMSPGTPRYMSPEQIYGDELTPASDIFSLGLVAYELLSGKPAVQGRTTKETLLHQLSDKPIRLPPFLRVSPELRQMVDRMTMKRPMDRFQTTQEVMQHLSAVTNITSSRALPMPVGTEVAKPEAPELLSPKAKENLTMVGLVALSVLVIAAVSVPIYKVIDRKMNEMPPAPTRVVPPPQPKYVAAVDDEEPDLGPEEKPSGCGQLPPTDGQTTMPLKMGVLSRLYVLYVPKNYDADHRHPVLVYFHDHKSAASSMDNSGFRQLADEQQFIILAPISNGTDPINPWGYAEHTNMVKAALADVSAKFCVDESQIFSAAHGAAGEMAEALACAVPIAAIGTTSYLPVDEKKKPCKHLQPTPEIQLIGAKNIMYTPAGTSQCAVSIVTMNFQRKAEIGFQRNRCDGPDVPWHEFKHGDCVTRACPEAPFVSCLHDDAFEFDVIDLPFIDERSAFGDMCNNTRTKFDVAGVMWRFFMESGIRRDP